ncbi:HRSL1 enzyme, partial [Tichodroma muraria]|nr:HRSL1 enzyme [Tichodroma muraria]
DCLISSLPCTGKQDLKLGVHKVPVFTRKVKKQLLKEVVQNDKWCVNNKSDQYHTPLPVEEIIRYTEDYIDKDMTYRAFGSNCEHFVKKLRYGGQVSD